MCRRRRFPDPEAAITNMHFGSQSEPKKTFCSPRTQMKLCTVNTLIPSGVCVWIGSRLKTHNHPGNYALEAFTESNQFPSRSDFQSDKSIDGPNPSLILIGPWSQLPDILFAAVVRISSSAGLAVCTHSRIHIYTTRWKLHTTCERTRREWLALNARVRAESAFLTTIWPLLSLSSSVRWNAPCENESSVFLSLIEMKRREREMSSI